MRVVVDNDNCTGCGLCASICPDAFDMGNEGKAVPRHKAIPSWLEQDYEIAAENCPEYAIKIYSQV
jgi:ferredoxin